MRHVNLIIGNEKQRNITFILRNNLKYHVYNRKSAVKSGD
jgi:hypothetical protein